MIDIDFSVLLRNYKKCKLCDWVTVDTENKTGSYESHILKEHGLTINKFLEKFPDELEYFKRKLKQKKLESNPDNYVTCLICGKKFTRLSSGHLESHGITVEEYINSYGGKVTSETLRLKNIKNNKGVPLDGYKYPKKYQKTEEYTYKAVCKLCGFESKGFNNCLGELSKHLLNEHEIETPSENERKKYFINNDSFWYEVHFDIIKVMLEKKEYFRCPYCSWKTIDVDNRTGAYKKHLQNAHGITI
jgi:uncharacterized Zn-finger protein